MSKLLTKKVIKMVPSVTGEFVSSVFLREKKEKGKYRLILDLTDLNKFVVKKHFKMDGLEAALGLITPGCWMGSIDFQDAYYTLSVRQADRKYLRFRHQGQLFEFGAVPMGLSSACRLFTKCMKIPLSVLREKFEITISGEFG